MEAGAIAYFVKPFDDRVFLTAVYQATASTALNTLKGCGRGGIGASLLHLGPIAAVTFFAQLRKELVCSRDLAEPTQYQPATQL
jgi:hypothetical protein